MFPAYYFTYKYFPQRYFQNVGGVPAELVNLVVRVLHGSLTWARLTASAIRRAGLVGDTLER